MLTNVYVDGFNLYYGCLKGTPYKWLDLGALCQALLPPNKIQRIRYFTAKVSVHADPHQPVRQSAYLRALQTVPGLTVHLGNFFVNNGPKLTPWQRVKSDPSPGGVLRWGAVLGRASVRGRPPAVKGAAHR